MSELPEGWAECAIGDVTVVVGGGTPDSKDEDNFATDDGHAWITPADLSGYASMYVTQGKRNLTEKGLRESSAKLLPRGTVLMSSRAPIGYVAIAANEIATNQGFKSFICSDALLPEYVYYWLKYSEPELQELGSGSTFREISGAKAATIEIRVPPVAEQRRIVEKVEALLARIATATTKMQSVTSTITRIRRSILDAAYDGLLADTAASAFAPFGEIATELRGGNSTTSIRGETEWRVLKSSAVRPFEIDFTDLNFLPRRDDCVPSAEVRKGDLLITRLSGSIDFVGNCALVWARPAGTLQIPDRIFRARVSEDFDPRFIEIVFNAPRARKPLEDAAKSSAGHQRISLSNIREVAIPRFPRIEQARIVDRFTSIMREISAVERRLRVASESAEAMRRAILAKAFAGELVPTEVELARREGRSYEPASVLLERVRGERESAQTAPRRTGRAAATSASRGARSPRR